MPLAFSPSALLFICMFFIWGIVLEQSRKERPENREYIHCNTLLFPFVSNLSDFSSEWAKPSYISVSGLCVCDL